MRNSCKGCPDKKEGCHDGCVKYVSDWLAYQTKKSEIMEGRRGEALSKNLVIESKKRGQHSKNLAKLAKKSRRLFEG